MSKVRILPPEIISKIAAGEVVERPASVLKELIENSIDAQASSIEASLKEAGKSLIKVKDNGIGISEPDIDSLFTRHATSKIQEINDLYRIESLGFRGEALYSIAAISDISLSTKIKEQAHGWNIHLRAGRKLSQKPLTMHTGTDIEVNELFFNTPARKKFLKSNSSELNRLLDIFIPYTLLYPRIHFSLVHESRKIIALNQANSLCERISSALHLDLRHIMESRRDFNEEGISLHLVLGDINIQRTRPDMQFIFVNNRPVQNKALSFNLNDLYRIVFSRGVYPFFCVYITMPPCDVDVNVHPTKREVKIRKETEIASRLRGFAQELLMAKSKAKQFEKTLSSSPEKSFSVSRGAPLPSSQGKSETLKEIPLFQKEPRENEEDNLRIKLNQCRYIGNLLNKYLLFETPESLLVIDQHAAAERINFEKLKKQIKEGNLEVQNLLIPILIKISSQETLRWEENKETIERLGFSCGLFDKETLAIHAHPQLINRPENSIRGLLSDEPDFTRADIDKLAGLACRSSVTAGHNLNKEAAEYQRSQLLICESPFTCPHGRPTVIEIPEQTISKQFLRT